MEAKPTTVPISSPWRATLLEAVRGTQQQLFIICPYIKEEVISAIRETLHSRDTGQTMPLAVRILTRMLAEELLNGSSDISALEQFLHWPDHLAETTVELRAISNIHAKVWIFDASLAIVGSGNATPSGLEANLEYGLAVSDPHLVARIQQDWEQWWQRAEPVQKEQINHMRDWLEQNSKMLQPLTAQIEEERKEIERSIGKTPHIGKRLSPSARGKQARPSRIAERRVPYASPISQQEALIFSASHLYQALNWISPPLEDDARLLNEPDAFMKLSCTAISASEYMLRCVWADGKRFSQATITGRAIISQQPWTLTLDIQQVSVLQHLLNLQADIASGQDEIALYFSEENALGRLHIIRQYAENIVGEVNITGSLTNPPSPFPRLHSPLSRITVNHHQLAQIPVLIEQQISPQPILIQMSLKDIAGEIGLQITAEAFDSSAVISIPGTEITLIGPSLSLSLDYRAFHQVLTRAPRQMTTWQIGIDRDATAVQFLPNDGDNIWRSWKHQLWHREN